MVYTLRMTWIERVELPEFIDEMRRKPDAELLVEWIDVQLRNGLNPDPDDITDLADAAMNARAMISVYQAALEDA